MTRHLARLVPFAAAAIALAACGKKSASPDASYSITFRYCAADSFTTCGPDPSTQATTDQISTQVRTIVESVARDKVIPLITAGLVPAKTRDGNGPLTCGDDPTMSVVMNETVHNLLLLVTVKSFNDSGTLAASGPCIERGSSHLPLVAIMQISPDHVNDSSLEITVFHEMLHTLGFGTVWKDDLLVSGAFTMDSGFTGGYALATAKADNQAPGGWTSLPLENCGFPGPADAENVCKADPALQQCCTGTRDSHWENTFFVDSQGEELMTGYINPNTTFKPLSKATIASLGDLGYSVDLTRADPFTISSAALRALTSEPVADLSHDILPITARYADDGVEAP